MHLNWEFKLSTVDIDSVEQGHGYENTKEEYITIGKMRPWWLLREGLNLKKNLEFSRFSSGFEKVHFPDIRNTLKMRKIAKIFI